jgi:hypothetical protein
LPNAWRRSQANAAAAEQRLPQGSSVESAVMHGPARGEPIARGGGSLERDGTAGARTLKGSAGPKAGSLWSGPDVPGRKVIDTLWCVAARASGACKHERGFGPKCPESLSLVNLRRENLRGASSGCGV